MKPASAKRVAYPDCLAGIDTVARFVSGAVFGAATAFVRQSNFAGAGRLATTELRALARARSAFIAAGYRPTFPTVRDLDAEIAAAMDLVAIVKANRIEQLPSVFLRLSSAGDQYVRDSPDSVCAA